MSSTVHGSREEGRSQALEPSPARATEYVAGDQGPSGDFVAASEKTLHDVARSALLEADFVAAGLIRCGAAEEVSRQ